MKRTILLTFAFAATFCLGFAFNKITTTTADKMKRVTGIGGVFFKCKDPKKVRAWYKEHLGLNTNEYGAVFE